MAELKKKHAADAGLLPAEGLKRARFTEFDIGVEANECVKIFLVSKKEEVDAENSCSINAVDLNQFFGEDGKIYGYKDLKITIWLNSRTFQAYPDITFSKSFKGKLGITDLSSVFGEMFGESLVVDKDEFLDTFSTGHNYVRDIVSSGFVVDSKVVRKQNDSSEEVGESSIEYQLIRMDPSNASAGQLYSRLVPLVLFLVDGGSPIDTSDSRWDVYYVIEKLAAQTGCIDVTLLGFATVYRFYHYPSTTRFRISQMLVLPPYQGKGHGRHLLEGINKIAVSEDVFDVTFEEPSDYLQKLRGCVDCDRLQTFDPVVESVTKVASKLKDWNSAKNTSQFHFNPPAYVIEEVRRVLKINKKQFLWCWEILLYHNLEPKDQKNLENFKASISARLRAEIIEKDGQTGEKSVINVPSEFDSEMSFVVFKTGINPDNNGMKNSMNDEQEEQINQLVDRRLDEVTEIAKKLQGFH